MKVQLPKLFKRILLCCILFLGLNSYSYASHVMGSELTYTCVAPNQYEITLRVFRDCNGISMPTSFSVAYSGCGNSGSVSVSLQGSSDITPVCSSQTSSCSGGSSPVGVEEYLYKGTVTVPPNCANITFSTSTCCRNGIITNINSPSSNDFYIRSTLNNNLSACNSSPTFASAPTPFTCVNQPVTFPQLASDPDGDVLVYSLTNCLQGSGTNVTYAGGFNGASPLTVPVTLDPNTGELSFTPNTTQVAAICILVEEFRGGVKVGEIIRDMQFVIQNCTNTLPTLSGIDGVPGVFDIDVCEGAPLCFDIDASDVNAGDDLTMTFSGNIPGSTFTQSGSGNNRTGTFCWTPPIGAVGSYVFSVIIDDDACPIPGQNSKAYTVNVIANPNPPVVASANTSMCAGDSRTLTASNVAPNISWSPAVGLSTTTGTSTNASPAASTTYTVTALYPDGCRSTDDVTVTINPDPVASISQSTGKVCPGGNFQLTGTTDATGMVFQWFNPSMGFLGSGTVSGTSSNIVVTVPSTPGSYTYTLRVRNPSSGCISEDVVTLEVGAPPALPACVNIYASPTGSAAAAGTQANPTSLAEALTRGACQSATIKLATGTYTLNSPLTLTSQITIEGGFNPTTWVKTSQPGATTINRTTANPEGNAGARRLVAFYGNSVLGFRFQDVTITTSNANQAGMSTYGLHLTNCSNYEIVRTQILPGRGGNGTNGVNGNNGGNGCTGGYGGAGRDRCNSGCDSGGGGGGGGCAGAGGTGGGGAPSGTAGGTGGRGGNGANDCSTNAQNGTGTTCAGGGARGGNSSGTTVGGAGGSCNIVGAAGVNGNNGVATIGTFFTPASGTNGTRGNGGRGGGGGGGGGENTDGCNASGNGGSGGGGGGGGGGAGSFGTGGGASFSIFALSNGAGAQIIDSRLIAGIAGAAGIGGSGGNGGAGGAGGAQQNSCNGCGRVNRGGRGGNGSAGGRGGNGGNGSAGISVGFRLNGTSPVISNNGGSFTLSAGNNNPAAFNLAAQTVITASNVNCTNTNVNYTTTSASTWDFDRVTNNAVPATAGTASSTNTQYTQVGRYTVSRGTHFYRGFHNISFDGSIEPDIATNANPLGPDTFQLCRGDFATFESIYPGDSYQWNFNGAITNPGTNVQVTPSTQFNTPGFYAITLRLTTDCCGLSPTRTIYLYVDEIPTVTASGAGSICPGNNRTLTLSGLAASDHVIWSPTTDIISSTANTITVSPSTTTTYTASIYTRTVVNGVERLSCPINRPLTVTVNAEPTMSITETQPSCGNNGQLVANITSGGGLYNFVWSNGPITFNSTSSSNSSLGAGVYNVTASNTTTGCTVTESSFLFPAPGSPTILLQNSTPATCGQNNGTATVLASGGGVGVFTYAWSSGGLPTASRTNLAPGNYCVTATKTLTGCTATICFDITAPGTVSTSLLSTTNLACPGDNNGSATVEGIGGQGVHTYLWSNGETNATAIALPAGSSVVTVTDDAGCFATRTVVLTATNTISTAPTIAPLGTVCPNTNTILSAVGGIAGTGSSIRWYTGANGTGTFLGTGNSITVAPDVTTTYYARREGTCNTTIDASVTLNVKAYIYALNGTSTNTYCTDNAGWHHFFVGDNIIFSTRGDLSNAPAGFPIATILDNGTYYQTSAGLGPTVCAGGINPGEEWFEMERSWNLDMGGGAPIGTYETRFYYEPAERTAIETAAANWITANPACSYSYKYPYPLGFYWFKDVAQPYSPATYDGTHYTGASASIGTTGNGINYTEWNGVPSFSGGTGAIKLVPDPLLAVDWEYFTGVTDGRINYLEWATASEENTAYFEVQRSIDGIKFEKIAEVKAKGFSQNISEYTFDDLTPFKGLNYYRLRLFDRDGASNISNVVALEIGDDNKGYVFFPNPTENVVSYQFGSELAEDVEIEILDVLGRSLQTVKRSAVVGTNRLKIDLKDYPNGSYIVRATHLNSGAVHTAKIVKKTE